MIDEVIMNTLMLTTSVYYMLLFINVITIYLTKIYLTISYKA